MIVDVFGESLSPGNEQRDFWGSKAADQPGSRNTIGIKDPIVDEIVELIIAAGIAGQPHQPDEGARPGSLVGALSDTSLAHQCLPRRVLGQVFPACDIAEVRLRATHLVDRSGQGKGPSSDVIELKPARFSRRTDMLAYIIRRLLLIVPTLLAIMILNFAIIQLAPGGPLRSADRAARGHGRSAPRSGSPARAATPAATAAPRALRAKAAIAVAAALMPTTSST